MWWRCPKRGAHVARDILHAERMGVRGILSIPLPPTVNAHIGRRKKTKADKLVRTVHRIFQRGPGGKNTVVLCCIVRSWRLESLRCRIVTVLQPGILSRPSSPPHPSTQISLKAPPPLLYVYIQGKGEERRKEIYLYCASTAYSR